MRSYGDWNNCNDRSTVSRSRETSARVFVMLKGFYEEVLYFFTYYLFYTVKGHRTFTVLILWLPTFLWFECGKFPARPELCANNDGLCRPISETESTQYFDQTHQIGSKLVHWLRSVKLFTRNSTAAFASVWRQYHVYLTRIGYVANCLLSTASN